VVLWFCVSVVLWLCGSVFLCFCGSVVLCFCGSVVLWFCVSVVLWFCVSVVLWFCGSVVLWFCDCEPLHVFEFVLLLVDQMRCSGVHPVSETLTEGGSSSSSPLWVRFGSRTTCKKERSAG